jgi:hypothetical protein
MFNVTHCMSAAVYSLQTSGCMIGAYGIEGTTDSRIAYYTQHKYCNPKSEFYLILYCNDVVLCIP